MSLFTRQQFAQLALFATLARCALACGADTDHAPPIGSPTGPTEPIIEQGGRSSGGSGGQAEAALAGGAATIGNPAATPGAGGDNSFAGNGSGGNTFGVGGSATASDPFGIGGTSSGFSGGF